MTPEDDKKIAEALKGFETRKNGLLKMASAMMEAYDGAIYPVDLFATGVIKRTLSTINGLQLLIDSRNMVCARTILRTQLDSTLRFYAVFLVENPHDFARKVLEGKQINKIKDKKGKFLSDRYLVNKLSVEFHWIKDVYQNLSGYIHFSDSHIINAVDQSKKSDNSIYISIQEIDTKYPLSSWLEVIECFKESVDIFARYLNGWIITKNNPELVKNK